MAKTALAELPYGVRNFDIAKYHNNEQEGLLMLGYVSGLAVGQAMKIDDMQKQLDEMTEMLEIARAFQREKDVQSLFKLQGYAASHVLRDLPL